MRLALYSDAMTVGGAEIAAGHLFAELDGAIEAVVVGVEPAVVTEIASWRPGTRQRIVRRVRNKADLRGIAAHARAMRAVNPDVLQVNLFSPWAAQYGILAGVLARTRVVAVEHSVAVPTSSSLQRRFRRALCSQLAAHVAVGDSTARLTEELIGLPRGSVETIHNGVPDTPLQAAPAVAPGPLVGALGRFSREKGFDILIRAVALLPRVTCVLVGDGPERPNLERLADDLGIRRRVLMTGWVSRARSYLPSFDLVAFPSRFEGLPLAVVEGMLAKRAVIASDVGSVGEAVVDGVTGLLVPPEDPDALAAAIARLIDDSKLRSRMGIRGRERALAHFSSQTMARSYEALYQRLLD
jgi:glycosyltransferase involved in cell wall biosynthesis